MISRVKHVSFYSMSMTVSLNRDGHQCPFFVPLTPVCSLHLILTSCTLIALQNVRMLHDCEPRRRMWLFEALDGGGFPIRPSMCPVAACVSVGELVGHFMGKQMWRINVDNWALEGTYGHNHRGFGASHPLEQSHLFKINIHTFFLCFRSLLLVNTVWMELITLQ